MAKAPAKKKSPSEKKPSLDIFDEMRALDRKDFEWLDNQPEELRKTFSPLIAMRWFSAVGDRCGLADYHVLMTNELVNIGFWDLSKYPDLQYRLMAAAGSGQVQRHNWIPGSKRKNSNKLDKFLLGIYPHLNDDELTILKGKHTVESIKQLCKDTGMPDADVKPIVDDFKKLSNGS
jgi:hypothetical protein